MAHPVSDVVQFKLHFQRSPPVSCVFPAEKKGKNSYAERCCDSPWIGHRALRRVRGVVISVAISNVLGVH